MGVGDMSFKAGKVFKENTLPINSMDFSDNGELLVTASDDESLRLYSCVEGTPERMLYSKKYGVDQVRFTHHNNTVICASKNNWDQTVRYLSLHDNRFLRYFKGHRDRVTSLSMSPADDHFLSASLDGSVRLWDLRVNGCQGMMRLGQEEAAGGQSLAVAFDPEGLIFAVAGAHNHVKLYDARTYDQGPFSTFAVQLPHPSNPSASRNSRALQWTGLEFTNDGRHILLSSHSAWLSIDAFKGQVVAEYGGHANDDRLPLVASASPDCKHVLCGSAEGKVHVWDLESGRKSGVWQDQHPGPVTLVRWNPTYRFVASACTALCFWLPQGDDVAQPNL